MAKRKRHTPIRPDRVRTITSSFGWIDHRFVRGGFLEQLHSTEALLYCFLAVVADAKGMSYYGLNTIQYLLRIPFDHALEGAIRELESRDLIAYRTKLFQVLSLPASSLEGGK